MKIFFSVIIPVRVRTKYLQETLYHLKQQTYRHYEVIVITDKDSQTPNPSVKRNLGAAKARGNILAFLDDDSFPDKNWLLNAFQQFSSNPNLISVCGPCLTPENDSLAQKASGLFWGSFLGSGGAGTYRNQPQSARFVDDYPSVNLMVKKKDFNKIGGFPINHWPGEDTLLCRNLIHEFHQKIFYHPSIIVFHHRRSVFLPHLKQLKRYAVHRGFFAKKYPENSFKIGYFLPSIFSLYLILLPFLFRQKVTLIPLIIYVLLLFLTLTKFLVSKNHPFASFLAAASIPVSHFYYGCWFIYGFFSSKPIFSAHQINPEKNSYIGG
ncbi:glycosyltransferase [Patescibacteria group bacterium]|nr:glycosyltransferase [Patescibacteria group bacterium]